MSSLLVSLSSQTKRRKKEVYWWSEERDPRVSDKTIKTRRFLSFCLPLKALSSPSDPFMSFLWNRESHALSLSPLLSVVVFPVSSLCDRKNITNWNVVSFFSSQLYCIFLWLNACQSLLDLSVSRGKESKRIGSQEMTIRFLMAWLPVAFLSFSHFWWCQRQDKNIYGRCTTKHDDRNDILLTGSLKKEYINEDPWFASFVGQLLGKASFRFFFFLWSQSLKLHRFVCYNRIADKAFPINCSFGLHRCIDSVCWNDEARMRHHVVLTLVWHRPPRYQ